MFNTLNHKGNANLNYPKFLCHPSQISNQQKNKQQEILARMWGEKESSNTVGEHVNYAINMEIISLWIFLKT
jgi:hypothetical protein